MITEMRNVLLTIARRHASRKCSACPLVLDRLTHRARPLDHRRRRMAGHQIDQEHIAAGVFHYLATYHLVTSVIGAFDQYRGPYPLDQFKWRVLVKDDDEIDGFECRQYFRASLSRIDRSSFALEPRGGRVAVEADHEPVARGPRFSQQLDVPAMQEIEAAIGKADAQAMA